MPTVLKVARQGQLTLTRKVLAALGNPRFFEAEILPDRTLLLRPALKMTLDEAEEAFAEHGITKEVLVEALPYISEFRGKTVVVKIGGAALEDPLLRRRFAEDLILLDWVGIDLVVVHGGGRQITQMLDRVGQQATFVDGQRVTDASTLEVVEMVLGGALNQELVRLVNHLGGAAVGLTGCDGGLARARIVRPELGLVGEVEAVDREVIDRLLPAYIPVVAPLATGPDGNALNVNADVFAARLAQALGAEKLVLLTDIAGVLDRDRRLRLVHGRLGRLRDRGGLPGRPPPRPRREGRRAPGVVPPRVGHPRRRWSHRPAPAARVAAADRDRGRRQVAAAPLPHHRTCGSASGGSVG
ncbi:acetylglutamate kinase [Acidobacteria bacterium ACD]|nr:acetylglutamate kinase [Acidobacteria bacterium ACD]